MRLDVVPTVNESVCEDIAAKTVIVIDVLRATSTIVTALAYGCLGVVPVSTIEEARCLQRDEDLLGGERFCQKIIGFDFGNSSLEYMCPEIKGKRLIITTTNGTRAIDKYRNAQHMIAGSMLNAAECAKLALELNRDIVIVCAGTRDHFCLEDGLCAGLMIDELILRCSAELETNDMATILHLAYKQTGFHLKEIMMQSANGQRLSSLGFTDDVNYCSQVNLIKIVPILSGPMLVPHTTL